MFNYFTTSSFSFHSTSSKFVNGLLKLMNEDTCYAAQDIMHEICYTVEDGSIANEWAMLCDDNQVGPNDSYEDHAILRLQQSFYPDTKSLLQRLDEALAKGGSKYAPCKPLTCDDCGCMTERDDAAIWSEFLVICSKCQPK